MNTGIVGNVDISLDEWSRVVRVVVTGVSGDFGSSIVPTLLRRGHEVVGLSRRPHSLPFSNYTHVAADVRDVESLRRAIDGADAVVHLAWTTHPMHDVEATRAIDIGGTQAVVDAMLATGVNRLVATSSVMAYGANADNPALLVESDPLRPSPKHLYSMHKAEAEGIVTSSGLSAVLVRATNVMGRDTAGVTAEGFAGPVVFGLRGAQNKMQFIHPDDLARFYAEAIERDDWTGPVNLAAPEVLTIDRIGEILEKRAVRLDARKAEKTLKFLWDKHIFQLDPGAIEALTYFPLVDTTRLSDELGFEVTWSSEACVEDFKRTNREHVFLGPKKVSVPWRWPYARVPVPPTADGRHAAAPEGVAGAFDTLVNPEYPVLTAANISEAFPGPMTPLTVELSLDAMRAAGRQCADVLQLDGELRRALSEDHVGVFGHAMYANMTVILVMGQALPGGDASMWEDMLFGEAATANVPRVDQVSNLGMVKRLPNLLAKAIGLLPETKRIEQEARESQQDAAMLTGLSEAALEARLRRLRDDTVNAWATAAQSAVFITAIMGAIEKQAGKKFAATIRGGTEELASAGILRGCYTLADVVRTDRGLAEALNATDPVAVIEREYPRFAAQMRSVLQEYGHRGPRETELAVQVFADSPARLLDTVAKLASVPPRELGALPPMGRRLRTLAKLGSTFQNSRERVRDAAIRYTHQYRLVAREYGRRLADRGVIAAAEDVFFLSRDEIVNPPANARDLIASRKADHARLQEHRPPLNFVSTWETGTDRDAALQAGQALTGVGVSAGIVKGQVRVLTPESLDDLEPGEVLVARFTDVGWTPFFSYAAAVVVDTGAEMSHAAVVAREYGIPCVVGTGNGSEILSDGQWVEVDGSAGTITLIEAGA